MRPIGVSTQPRAEMAIRTAITMGTTPNATIAPMASRVSTGLPLKSAALRRRSSRSSWGALFAMRGICRRLDDTVGAGELR